MAIYHLSITPIGRSAGRRATGAAAYRAGERIRDERGGKVFDHSRRSDVLHKEIVLPAALQQAAAPAQIGTKQIGTKNEAAEDAHRPGVDARTREVWVQRPPAGRAIETSGPAWARDRARLWNAAERVERRRNSRVAREFMVALPFELDARQRVALARRFSQELADRYNVAVDLAVHAARPEGDVRNVHAHLLATTREVTWDGFGEKVGLDMRGSERHRRGLTSGIAELKAVRERWAFIANEALREAHIQARIDHRSLYAQGIDRAPTRHIPFALYQAQRRARRAQAAERAHARDTTQLGLPSQREGAIPLGAGTAQDAAARAAQAWAQMRRQQAREGAPQELAQRAAQEWARRHGPQLGPRDADEAALRAARAWAQGNDRPQTRQDTVEDPARRASQSWQRMREWQHAQQRKGEDSSVQTWLRLSGTSVRAGDASRLEGSQEHTPEDPAHASLRGREDEYGF